MGISVEYSELEGFDRQLESVERMLQAADEYNERLAAQIENVKKIVSSNQNIIDKLQASEQAMVSLLDDDSNAEIHAQLMKHVARIEKKLYVILSLFNGLKSERKDNYDRQDHRSNVNLSQQISGIGAQLIAIGNELMLLRQDKASAERVARNLHQWSCKGPNKARLCWTQCRTPMQDNLQTSELAMLRKETELLSQTFNSQKTPVGEVRFQKQIIKRVEGILTKAEYLNIKTETLTNVKVLSKIVLRALIKRRQLHQFCGPNKLSYGKESKTISAQVAPRMKRQNSKLPKLYI